MAEWFEPTATCQLLLAAGKHMVFAGMPFLFADSHIENIHSAVEVCAHRTATQVYEANLTPNTGWRWLSLGRRDANLVRDMTEAETRAQARRARMSLRKTHLGESAVDLSPVYGAEAISLVYRLTRMSYSLAGEAPPVCTRSQMPCRFVRRRSA